MFAPLDNVPEDPATGSTNIALVGMLTTLNPETDGEFSCTLRRGLKWVGRVFWMLAQKNKMVK